MTAPVSFPIFSRCTTLLSPNDVVGCHPRPEGHPVRRREFIPLLGSTTVWPLAAHAQQAAMPVVGFLHVASAEANANVVAGFHQGLRETGYVDGQNV